MKSLSSQPYKGTRDYYPSDKRIQNYIFSVWKKSAESFGYEEYGAPILEPLEVYTAKSGQELATEQTYTFIDRGGRTVAIRPEMTPTISRMVAAKRKEIAFPARLYSIANFMRYERPQRGREREFWQLNVDIFGQNGVSGEAEILSLADKIMKQFGAKKGDYVIRVNNRKLINFVMSQYLGLNEQRAEAMMKLFDRKNKIEKSEFDEQVAEIFAEDKSGINKVQILTNAKSMADLPDEIKSSSAVKEIQDLFTLLDRLSVEDLVFDITLMRGLDYYTGMVFEVFDTHPENNRALFGGGRYDGLVGLFGAEPLSAVGMAPGGTTMQDFLTVHNLLPEVKSTTDVYIALLGDYAHEGYKVVDYLRENGVNVEFNAFSQKAEKSLKTAIKKSIPSIIFIGEQEVANNIYTVKDVNKSQEYKLKLDELTEVILG